MHRDVMALVEGGHSAQEIIDAFVGTYSQRVLMAPPRSGIQPARVGLAGNRRTRRRRVRFLAFLRRSQAPAPAPLGPRAHGVDATDDAGSRVSRRRSGETITDGRFVVGTLLALGALAFVLYPVFFGSARRLASPPRAKPVENDDASAVAALRELEFDRATGKLSDSDYTERQARYTKSAVAEMRRQSVSTPTDPSTRPTDDELEAQVRAQREATRRLPDLRSASRNQTLFIARTVAGT